jgi:hypothetical protein
LGEIAKGGLVIRSGGQADPTPGYVMQWIMTNERVSVIVAWKQTYANTLLQDAHLIAASFVGRLQLPAKTFGTLTGNQLSSASANSCLIFPRHSKSAGSKAESKRASTRQRTWLIDV